MREVGVHDYDEVAGCVVQAVDVCGAETKLACSWLEDDIRWLWGGWVVCFHELFGDFLCAVRGAVIDYYDFPVEVSRWEMDYQKGLDGRVYFEAS